MTARAAFDLRSALRLSPVVPVLVVERAEQAVPLGMALLDGGLRVLEVTLRTPAALEAIRRLAGEVEGAVVAAGTVLNARDLDAAAKAGARFAVSPGLTDFARDAAIPVLPGVATASDIMRGLDQGLDTFKFFPAVPAGGVRALSAFAGPFPDVAFGPTGGIDAANAPEFLALPNVLCVGGSWPAPAAAVEAGAWAAVGRLAHKAASLRARP
jgi:2-dehydro-3-deoxyphosphogluconate aldolase/(4S)-4-hydroxy-2-oxoglutarate aldolase